MLSTEVSWLLRRVELDGTRTDCRLDNGRITALGLDLPALTGDRVIDACGGALLPGLADHHIHLLAVAAARRSIDLAGGHDLTEVRDRHGTGWLRVIGAGTELRREDIDRVRDDRPIRIQHRSGALWTLNSPAVELLASALSRDETATGQLWRADGGLRQLLDALPDSDSRSMISLRELRVVGRQLAASGVTHLTDATPDLTGEALALLRRELPQRIMSLGPDGDGPRKLVIAEHVAVSLTDLIDRVRAAHDAGRAVAVHAVTQQALALAIAALRSAGSVEGDRIEHAAICDDQAAEQLAELGVTVVTQPSVLTRHGLAYWRDTEVEDRRFLWRYASLRSAGVSVAVSSDAPYGEADPWRTIRAAATRELADHSTRDEAECVSPAIALRSMITDLRHPAGPARQIAPGVAADLALLRYPLATALRAAEREGTCAVLATFIAGAPVHLSAQVKTDKAPDVDPA
ncbi:MAG TPA: amidohydrolase family protein [Mycobacteriales bacterium]|nr:amidohydrolase family protein [Mycobacteriales bacterium]